MVEIVICGTMWQKVLAESTGPIFTKFSELVDIWVKMITLIFTLRYADVAMVTTYGDK